jgi:adenosine deaminase
MSATTNSPVRSPLFALPKAELHLHIEGTLEPELVFALAERNGIELPYGSVDELRSRYDFSDLQSFLDLYYACTVVLRTARDFTELAAAYLEKARSQGVRHVELFFDPQAHLVRGVSADTVIDGLSAALRDAERDWGMTGGLILCFLRDQPAEAALELLESVAHRASEFLGVGLDSAEVGYPPELFETVYRRAHELGLHAVAHAGEEGGPEYVWGALDSLGVERVDHGVRSLEDPALVERLRRDGVPLTVCPLSTVALGGTPTLAEHPLPHLQSAGLVVTINSDDPSFFGGYVGDNYVAVQDAFGFDDAAMAAFARNSVSASFASEERKAALLGEIAEWVAERG